VLDSFAQVKIDCIFAVQNKSVGSMNRKLKAKLVVLELHRGLSAVS